MIFDEAYKNKIGIQLTKRVATALKDKEITLDELPLVSSYILDNIDNIKDDLQLIDFLTKLSQQWPFFSQTFTLIKGEMTEKKEEEKVAEMTKLVRENKIEEALQAGASVAQDKKEEKKDGSTNT